MATSVEAGSAISQRRWIPVHAAIYCQEILRHIFSYYADVPSPAKQHGPFGPNLKTQGATLANLARTCRAFSEPALDTLWRRMDRLAPFIFVFSCAEEVTSDLFGLPEYRLRGEASEAEWNRFLKYTRLVRELYLRPFLGYQQLSDGSMRYLLERLEGRPLFPRLQVLHSLDVSHGGFDRRSALLYSGLRVLSLSMMFHFRQPTSDVIPRALETVHTASPELTTLILAVEEGQDIEIGVDALATIVSFRCLRELHLRRTLYLNYASLVQLANLELLERVSAGLRFDDAPPSHTACFRAVHDLDLRGSSEALTAFFAHFTIPGLQTLAINPTVHDLDVILSSAMADLFDRVPRTITSLLLEQGWMSNRDAPNLSTQTPTLVDMLQPLLQFRLLHRVEINFEYLPPVDDGCIKSMLEAWPNLTHLAIAPGRPYPSETFRLPTMNSLVLAATTYPKLEQLHLPLTDVSNVHILLLQQESFPGHSLKAVSLAPKCREDNDYIVRQIACLVDRLFPHLEFPLQSAWNYCRQWRAVKTHLVCMSAGRKHASLRELLERGRVVCMCACRGPEGINQVPDFHVHVTDKIIPVATSENWRL
ncbi:hypothetical protein GY45DRAFT_328476 [Cubamyces sp. BRFM 1775]|nr:hypothetical protein GY45DRAFT_328476 [Cubamyces sp. BRFM 1775]